MKPFWIALSILVAMALLLLFNMNYLTKAVEPLEASLSQAADAAREGDWETAERLTRQVKETWEEHAEYFHYVQNHTDIDEISVLLDESMAYIACQDTGEFVATNARALSTMDKLRDLEQLAAGNLF